MSSAKKARYKQQQKDLKFRQSVKHSFIYRVCKWSYCSGCGLVALNNDVTRKAMMEPCQSMEE